MKERGKRRGPSPFNLESTCPMNIHELMIIIYFMIRPRRGSLDNKPRPLKMSSTGPVGLVSRILFPQVLTRSAAAASGRTEPRQRLVVLGCGWGSYSLLRSVNKKKFDVICISPRNHFLFTPLLASTTVGKKEF